VHDVAAELASGIAVAFPDVVFDSDAVLLGAATHDIGKAVWPTELDGPGNEHERAGFELLCKEGWPKVLARFAATHADWGREDATVEDLLVAIADKVWKAKRVQDLEDRFIEHVADITGTDRWELFMQLDDILDRLAAGADARLAFQASFPPS
jgi:HD superfamily phosphodiesterase